MNTESRSRVPAIEGWFTTGPSPRLCGTKCVECNNITFPPTEQFCANPACSGREFTEIELSPTGTVWSYTDAQYQPPPPYLFTDGTYEPFALAAVKLEAEQMIVLAQVAAGYGVQDLALGTEVELVVERCTR